jgi:hypothetical protein
VGHPSYGSSADTCLAWMTLPAGTPPPSETIPPLPISLASAMPPGEARGTPLCGIRQLALP